MKTALFLIMCGITVMGCDQKSDDAQKANPAASGATATDGPAAPKPDNTAVNTRDRTPDAVTAGVQGQGRSDVDITADVRRRIMGGKM